MRATINTKDLWIRPRIRRGGAAEKKITPERTHIVTVTGWLSSGFSRVCDTLDRGANVDGINQLWPLETAEYRGKSTWSTLDRPVGSSKRSARYLLPHSRYVGSSFRQVTSSSYLFHAVFFSPLPSYTPQQLRYNSISLITARASPLDGSYFAAKCEYFHWRRFRSLSFIFAISLTRTLLVIRVTSSLYGIIKNIQQFIAHRRHRLFHDALRLSE